MKQPPQKQPSRWWAWIIGTGVALSPIHNIWLTNLTTNAQGETWLFLPAFGYLLMIMGTGLFLIRHWDRLKEVGWGDRRVVGCLLLIVMAIALSGVNYIGIEARFAPLGAGLSLLALYLASRILGRALFLPLAVGAVIASLGIIAHGFIFRDGVTGGFIFEGNYDIAIGYIALGAILYRNRWQWALIGLALVAIFLSGSPEGAFVTAVALLVVLLRKDWGWKLTVSVMPVVLVATIWFAAGWNQELLRYTEDTITAVPVVQEEAATSSSGRFSPQGQVELPSEGDLSALGYRWWVIRQAMTHVKPLGEGYNLTNFSHGMVHNVPLILVQQLGIPGILAALCWLFVALWCLVKTRWKYAWIMMLALGVFDHFTWTQMAPVYWMLAGVSLTDNHEDYVFRRMV